jgi:outer membrane autotransporter protein
MRRRLHWAVFAVLGSAIGLWGGIDPASAQTATNFAVATPTNTSITINIANHINGFNLALYDGFDGLQPIASPHGTLTLNGPGVAIIYTPNPGFSGTDSFIYVIDDPGPVSGVITVTVGLTSSRDPSRDPSALGVVGSMQQTVLFSALTQITNFNRHLDDLHDVLRDLNLPHRDDNNQNNQSSRTNSLKLASLVASALTANQRFAQNSGGGTGLRQTAEANPDAEVPIELPDRIGVFVNGNISLAQISGSGIRPDASPRTVSFSTGIDYRLSANAIVGIGAGYTSNTTDIGGGSKVSSNAYNLTVYGTTRPSDEIYIDGQASYGRVKFHSVRDVIGNAFNGSSFAFANPDADQFWGSLSSGYEFDSGAYTFGPYLRLDGSHSAIDHFSETGADIIDLSFSSQAVDSIVSVVGFRGDRAISTAYGIVSPHIRIEYQHEFIGATGASVGFANGAASGFNVAGYPMSRNYFTLGGGVSFLTINAISAFIDYDALVGYTGQTNHSITIGASARF